MNFFIGQVVMTAIQAIYPGGAKQFEKDGGLLRTCAGSPMKVYIYHPHMVADGNEKTFDTMSKAIPNISIELVNTLNFEGVDPHDVLPRILDKLEDAVINFLPEESSAVVAGDAVLFEVKLSDEVPEDKAQKIADTLGEVEGLIRGVVTVGDYDHPKFVIPVKPGSTSASTKEAKLEPSSRPERDRAIQDDEIMNLKIDLEAKSDEDIWKMFE